jgi:hypothetical protein
VRNELILPKATVQPDYFSVRLLNPYSGVLQVVDLGDSQAESRDGLVWHLKSKTGDGPMRQAGIWHEDRGLIAGDVQRLQALVEALEGRPELPFTFRDSWECWLLDQTQGRPLALLACDCWEPDAGLPRDLEWHPFVPSYRGFSSLLLVERDALTPYASLDHREVLSRLVNRAARPQPRAQWFQRDPQGGGEGLANRKLPHEWRYRRLSADGFPELLVHEDWNSRLENSVIGDYHAHLSPLLLLWPRLSDATRSRLELLACERPRWLARIHRLLAVQLHPEQLCAALVAAKLSQAVGENENPWIEH